MKPHRLCYTLLRSNCLLLCFRRLCEGASAKNFQR